MRFDRSAGVWPATFLLLLLLSLVPGSCAARGPARAEWNPRRTWVFMVGILQWANSDRFGSFPQENRRDAILLDLLRERGVPEEQILYLKDGAATTEALRRDFPAHLSKAQPGDWVFVYYCGHGYQSADHKAVYLASYDASDKVEGWRVDEIPAAIERNFKGSHAILALDNCYSGALADVVKRQKTRVSYAVLTAADANSFSTANWTFTESMIYALRGAPHADENGDGQVTLAEMMGEVEKDMLFGEEQVASCVLTGAFDGQLKLVAAQGRPAPRVGERLEAYSGGGWYKGIVLAAGDGKYRIHYYGYDENDDEWIAANKLRAVTPKQYRVGQPVEAEWQGQWYPGRVLDVRGGAHLVTYDGFGKEWDEWVPSKRVRLRGQTAYQVGDEVEVSWKNSWYKAKVIGVNEAGYYVHYLDYSKSWDEWVPPARIRPRG